MKHFKNIQSLNDLKDQYKKLALANHPDKGGVTAIMQEINVEYEVLFPIWKDRVKDSSEETAKTTRQEFYTQYGWKGQNYNSNLHMTDITKIIRGYVKLKYPTYKFSVRTRDVYSLDISLMEAPQDVFIYENLNEYEKKKHDDKILEMQLNHYHLERDNRLTELCREIMKDVINFAQTYNFDDSDSMIDYFHTNFYLHVEIGQWNKPFKIVEKTTRIKNNKQKETANSKNNDEQINITIEDYSEKSFIVRGDTYKIKDKLIELGGKYNKFLKGGAGYIYSNKHKDKVKDYFKLITLTE